MNKAYLSVIGVLLTLSVTLAHLVNSRIGEVSILRKVNKELLEAQNALNIRREKDRSTLVAREADRRSTGLKLAQAERALQNTLESNKTWSDTNVPTEVQEAILGSSDGLAVDSGGLTEWVLDSLTDQSN